MKTEDYILKTRRWSFNRAQSDHQRLRSGEHSIWTLIIFFTCSLCSSISPLRQESIYGTCFGILVCLFLLYLFFALFRVVRARDYFESRGPQRLEDIRN